MSLPFESFLSADDRIQLQHLNLTRCASYVSAVAVAALHVPALSFYLSFQFFRLSHLLSSILPLPVYIRYPSDREHEQRMRDKPFCWAEREKLHPDRYRLLELLIAIDSLQDFARLYKPLHSIDVFVEACDKTVGL